MQFDELLCAFYFSIGMVFLALKHHECGLTAAVNINGKEFGSQNSRFGNENGNIFHGAKIKQKVCRKQPLFLSFLPLSFIFVMHLPLQGTKNEN